MAADGGSRETSVDADARALWLEDTYVRRARGAVVREVKPTDLLGPYLP